MRILVCVGVCALVVAAGASPAAAQTASGGIKVGLTSSNVSASGIPGFAPEAKIGPMGGAWVNFGGKVWRVQPELLLTSRRFSSPSTGASIDISTRTIDLPVLVTGRFRPDEKARPMVFAGPYVSFINKSTQTIGNSSTDLNSQLKGADMGLAAGAGVEIAAKQGAVVLEGRYLYGLRNISEVTGVTFKSRTFMASFGYRF